MATSSGRQQEDLVVRFLFKLDQIRMSVFLTHSTINADVLNLPVVEEVAHHRKK